MSNFIALYIGIPIGALVLSDIQATPITSPPNSSNAFLVSRVDFPVVTTSSDIIILAPGLTSNTLLNSLLHLFFQ